NRGSARYTISRRGTFDNGNECNVNSSDEFAKEVEEDVCFPMSSEQGMEGIDFEEMEEFIEAQRLERQATYESAPRPPTVVELGPFTTRNGSCSSLDDNEKMDYFKPKTPTPPKQI